MPVLPDNPTLADFQRYVTALEDERGFSDQDVLQKCLMLGKEIGELFKAVRKHLRMKMDREADIEGADGELADVLIFVCSVANRLDVDLEDAFRRKERRNESRVWR